jgi:uncharacterized protein YdgA (DUF945 family)
LFAIKQGLLVKKGIVVLLVVLALVVLISPGLIGRMAEKSVEENLNWAAEESGALAVTSENFSRGWFSSEGQHRIEISDDKLKAALGSMAQADDIGPLPVLIIDTHLDHGLVAVSSLAREKGSLTPGLGSAVSTLRVELPDGETIELPGSIYSKIGLSGELQSNYVLPAGSFSEDSGTLTWGESDIDFSTNPNSGKITAAGRIGSLNVEDGDEVVAISGLTFSTNQVPTQYGFYTGDVEVALGGMSVTTGGMKAGGIKRMKLDANSAVKSGLLSGRTQLTLDSEAIPQFGEVSVIADVSLSGADAEAIGALQQAMQSMQAQAANPDPQQIMALLGDDLKQLLATGMELRFDQLDVTLPMGTVKTRMDFKVKEDSPATFEWTSLLLATEASADISIPEGLIEMATQMNPQMGAALGMGFLQKNGDVYELKAEYAKGLLTVNGTPMPIPLSMFQ